MNQYKAKTIRLKRRAARTRSQIFGTAARPRLSVQRSLKHISAQLINDEANKSLGGVNDAKLKGTKTEKAKLIGKAIADVAKKLNITEVVFDRGSYLYHGRVKAVAEAARENGLKF
jgi:large subunit ribosomal protein L18